MTNNPFINVLKNVRTIPVDYLLSSLINAVKHADPDVQSAFFAAEAAQPYLTYHKADVDPSLRELAVKYLSFVVSTNTAYGFNKAIQGADPGLINSWFAANTNRVGQNMLVDYMMQPNLAGNYFKDAKSWAARIAAEIGNDVFINGLLIECDEIGTPLPPRVALLLLREMDSGGSSFTKVLQAWRTNARWSEFEDYDSYRWLDPVQPSFAQGQAAYSAINSVVSGACTSHAAPETYNVMPPRFPPLGPIVPPPGNHTVTTYGPELAAWLNNPNGPVRYNLRSATSPNNVSDVVDDGAGCVIAGTPILMADGSTKPVEAIREGDQILSGDGARSVCSSELVVNDTLTRLYGLNDDEPFMSFEHAVMTQRGWCSLAPHTSMELTPHHSVKRLTKGDVVWIVDTIDAGELTYRKVVVERINIREYEPGTAPVGFDLHIRSGQPSYHARGYCCLVSYPEITAQRITANVLSEMSPAEQIQFAQQLEGISPLLGKAFGIPLLDAVKQALSAPRPIAVRGGHTDSLGVKRRHVRGAANMIVPKLFVTPLAPGLRVPIATMALKHGHLFIDDVIADTRCDEQHVFWNRILSNGQAEHGTLRLLSHGLLGDGLVRQGDQQIALAVDGMFGYHATYGADNTPWFDFDMGFRLDDKGRRYAVGELANPADPKQDAQLKTKGIVTAVFSQVLDKQSESVLHVDIELTPSFCAFGGSPWIGAEIDFTLDYTNFSGWVYPYDASQRGYRGAPQSLVGVCKDLALLQAMQHQLTQRMMTEPLKRGYLETSVREGAAAATSQPALALAGEIALSAENLFDLAPPDRANLHDLAFGKLKNLMLLALGEDNEGYLSWFGETAPSVGDGAALSQAEADLTKDPVIRDFLINEFAFGYLTQAFSQSTEPNIKSKFAAMSQLDPKLRFFWKGDGKTSFAQSKGYNLATSKLLDSSYAEVVAGLKDYLADNPVDWARQLYDFCTKGVVLNGLALQNTLDGQKKLTHLCSLLHALDPIARIERPNDKPISYASSLYQRVMEVRLNQVIKYATVADQTDFVQFLTEFFKGYFSSLLEGGGWDASIRAEALADLNQLMEQFRVDNVNDLVANLGSFIADSVSLLTNSKPMSARIQDCINGSALADRNPRLKWILTKSNSVLSNGLAIGLYGFGMYQAVTALMDWKDLAPQTKGQAIITVVDIAVSMFKDVVSFKKLSVIATRDAALPDLIEADAIVMETFSETTAATPLLDDFARVGDDFAVDDGVLNPGLLKGGQTIGRAILDAGDLDVAVARWTRISNIAETVAKGVAIVALAAACVGGGFQIANDFATDQPIVIKVLDIIAEVANAVTLVVEAITAALIEIPVVAVVAAVIGILISFISMFIHRKPPPTPEEVFVDEHCVPFVSGLDMPSQNWLDQQKKIAKPGSASPGLVFA